MTPPQRPQARAGRHELFWRAVNPLVRPLAGLVSWWVLLETVGARSGKPRQVPLAAGPEDADGMWLVSVHGRTAAWVRSLESEPRVRVRHRRRWRSGAATIVEYDATVAATFNVYARQGPRAFGIDPVLVRVDWRE